MMMSLTMTLIREIQFPTRDRFPPAIGSLFKASEILCAISARALIKAQAYATKSGGVAGAPTLDAEGNSVYSTVKIMSRKRLRSMKQAFANSARNSDGIETASLSVLRWQSLL